MRWCNLLYKKTEMIYDSIQYFSIGRRREKNYTYPVTISAKIKQKQSRQESLLA